MLTKELVFYCFHGKHSIVKELRIKKREIISHVIVTTMYVTKTPVLYLLAPKLLMPFSIISIFYKYPSSRLMSIIFAGL